MTPQPFFAYFRQYRYKEGVGVSSRHGVNGIQLFCSSLTLLLYLCLARNFLKAVGEKQQPGSCEMPTADAPVGVDFWYSIGSAARASIILV
jgi:hypothetical protein